MSFLKINNIPIDFKEEYSAESSRRNFALFYFISVGLLIIESGLLIFQTIRLGPLLLTIFYFDVYVMAIIFSGTFTILYTLYKLEKIKKYRSTVDIIFVLCLITLVLLTCIAELSSNYTLPQTTLFVIMMFSISTLIYLNIKAIICLLIGGNLTYMLITFLSVLPIDNKISMSMDYAVLLVVNICVAIVFHNARINTFMKKIEIEEANRNLQLTNQKLEKLNKQLEHISKTDALTGVLNRLAFNNILKEQWDGAKKGEKPLTAVMIDVDYFKRYNDFYGHIEGDKCLVNVTNAIIKSLRANIDFVFRYGGEEFVCLLPYTDVEGAKAVVGRIMSELKKKALPQSEKGKFITISCGIHCLTPSESDDMYEFIEKADDALYYSKQTGRNRYSVYDTVADKIKEKKRTQSPMLSDD